jgi:SAM-dependent methyltransferase
VSDFLVNGIYQVIGTRACPVCADEGPHSGYLVSERMLGLGDIFRYQRCRACGARALLNPPTSWERYYPSTYYSFSPPESRGKGGIVGSLRRLRNEAQLSRFAVLRAAAALYQHRPLGAAAHALVPTSKETRRPVTDLAVLEVGGGWGDFVSELADLGLSRLANCDPFAKAPERASWRHVSDMQELAGTEWDVIVSNHAIEHVADPVSLLRVMAGLLAPHGRILIRTPVADSWAADRYGARWVQHDAPRHLVIHTHLSLRHAGERAGLSLARMWDDAVAFQEWGSEAYRADRRLVDMPRPHGAYRARLRAAVLNRLRRGDQVCAVFTHAR